MTEILWPFVAGTVISAAYKNYTLSAISACWAAAYLWYIGI
jgi:hypothetical protein